jgi:pentatricopeptide repeat protein
MRIAQHCLQAAAAAAAAAAVEGFAAAAALREVCSVRTACSERTVAAAATAMSTEHAHSELAAAAVNSSSAGVHVYKGMYIMLLQRRDKVLSACGLLQSHPNIQMNKSESQLQPCFHESTRLTKSSVLTVCDRCARSSNICHMLLCRRAAICLSKRPWPHCSPTRRLFSRSEQPHATGPALSTDGDKVRSAQRSSSNAPTAVSSTLHAQTGARELSKRLTAHIGELSGQGRWRDVLSALAKAKQKGQALDCYNYNAALTAFTRNNQPQRALELLPQIRAQGVKFNVPIYNAIINACSKSGQWQQAVELLQEMALQNAEPDVKSYTAAIDACSKGGQWQLAIELLREMAQQGVNPTDWSYTAAIDACSRSGQWQQAIELLRELPHKGVKPNLTSYNSAINACSKCGQWQKALELLHDMPQQGVQPDLKSYTAAIDAFSYTGNWQQALELLREMQQQQIAPNVNTYNRVINACQNGGQWQLAVELLAALQAAGLQPNAVTYCCVIDALHAASEEQQAEAMYSEMLQNRLTQSHWSNAAADRGMLDLHLFSVGMAAAAVRLVLRGMLQTTNSDTCSSSTAAVQHVHDVRSDLHIITGHAMRREAKGASVLQPVIISMLKQRGIDCQVHPDNKGRLIVKSSELQQYAARAGVQE